MPTPASPLFVALTTLALLVGCASSSEPGTPDAGRRGPSEPRSCTEIGCSDSAEITTTLTSAGVPLGTHEFELEIDGVAQTCTIEWTSTTETTGTDCSGGASLSFGPVMRGVEHQMDGAVGYSEEPIPGEWQWRLSLFGTPKTAHVVHRHGDASIVDQTATFTYAEHRPNGEGCEPVCKSASVTWTGP